MVHEKYSQEQARSFKRSQEEKNRAFGRFILFRYSIAIFFFANVYWLMILWLQSSYWMIFPIILMFLCGRASAEQLALYGKTEVKLNWTEQALMMQGGVNSILLVLILLKHGKNIFPILADLPKTWMVVGFFLVVGLLTILFNLNRIRQVAKNQDSYYLRFQNIIYHS